ncbi:MAG TPA: choice-of-anchor tandem repeat GloVer-containing protein [Candidatus Binatia bacterium]|nr:choice-of-anchor tandem repeat GloVer-containing protein [Candidatus Binatia bacterium]
MTNPIQPVSHRRSAVSTILLPALLLFLSVPAAQAQTFTVLHNFTHGDDGANPRSGLTMDRAGNLYGTASMGGTGNNCNGGCGTVFRLSPAGSGWTFSPLYEFDKTDGAYPEGRLAFGPDGRLYGTTGQGGSGCQSTGCGVVFALSPPARFCQSILCYWTEDVLYQFAGGDDGSRPTGDTVFDSARNFFGTTYNSGAGGLGTVFELSPSGGGWSESVIHAFSGSDGANPYGGLALDASGALYGTTEAGGSPDVGVVFRLTNSGSGWSENILHNFNGTDGSTPWGGLVLDSAGNIYGTTNRGGPTGIGGKVFELSPSGQSWTFALLYGFSGQSGPWCDLVMDSAGNLYGTTVQEGAYNAGTVFKLTFSGGNWTYTPLHDFSGPDGAYPHGSIVLDANGDLYGTTTGGGPGNSGVVWEIAP